MKNIKVVKDEGFDIIKDETSACSYHTPAVDFARKVLGIDTEGDIIYNHKFIRIIFTPDNVPSEYRTDLIPGCKEHGIIIGNADVKRTAEMVFEVYRLIGLIDMSKSKKVEYTMKAWNWLTEKRGDKCDNFTTMVRNMLYDQYGFIAMGKPLFVDSLLQINVSNMIEYNDIITRKEFLKTMIDESSIKELSPFAPKENPTNKTEKKKSKENHMVPPAAVNIQTRFTKNNPVLHMKMMDVKPGLNFMTNINNIIEAYGGNSVKISKLDIPNFKYIRLEKEPENWDLAKVYTQCFWKEKSDYVKCHIRENKKPIFSDRNVYTREKIDKKEYAQERYNMYHFAVKRFVIPHYELYRKSVSMIDMKKEEYMLKSIINTIVYKNGVITPFDERDIEASYGDYSLQYEVRSPRNSHMMTWNERVRMCKSMNPKNDNETSEEYEQRIKTILEEDSKKTSSLFANKK